MSDKKEVIPKGKYCCNSKIPACKHLPSYFVVANCKKHKVWLKEKKSKSKFAIILKCPACLKRGEK